MKLIDIVEQLQKEGHSVEWRKRSDGGIIITAIDEKKFKSLSEGSKEARKIVGANLSEKQIQQRVQNVNKYIKGRKKPKKLKNQTFIEQIKKELRKAQRIWRQQNTGGGAKPSMPKVRWRIEHEGEEEAIRYVMRMQKYAQGIAWEDNVLHLCSRIGRLKMGFPSYSQRIEEIISKILLKIDTFRDEWIPAINDTLYKIEEGTMLIEDGLEIIEGIVN